MVEVHATDDERSVPDILSIICTCHLEVSVFWFVLPIMEILILLLIDKSKIHDDSQPPPQKITIKYHNIITELIRSIIRILATSIHFKYYYYLHYYKSIALAAIMGTDTDYAPSRDKMHDSSRSSSCDSSRNPLPSAFTSNEITSNCRMGEHQLQASTLGTSLRSSLSSIDVTDFKTPDDEERDE